MSRVHIHFIKEREDGTTVVYRVDSSDFNADQTEEPIARITINRHLKSYSFAPLGILSNVKVVPPHVYDLPESECDQILRVQYEGFGYGGWTSRIATVVRRLLTCDEFPDDTYGVT
jgi:hypothetical protein